MSASEQDRQRILNRLRRARGQMDAVIKAVQTDSPCRDVVTQLAAVSHAINRAGYLVVSTAMRDCLAPDGQNEDETPTPDELEKIFLTLA